MNTSTKADSDLAAKLVLNEAAKDSEISARATEYLDEQIALAKAQQQHIKAECARNQREAALHELHAENLLLQNHALRSQRAQFQVQRRHETLRTVYQSVLSVVAVALLALIAYTVYSAATDHSVVINQFQVPPEFVTTGENGTVVASEFLDQLQILQASALRSPNARSMEGAWANNIQLQIPDVHVSLADIHRTMHAWLGHEIQINGEVVLQGKQIALTVRGTGFAAQTFSGALTDLQDLLANAAEYVYVQVEPMKKP
jgi:hypothetical protein